MISLLRHQNLKYRAVILSIFLIIYSLIFCQVDSMDNVYDERRKRMVQSQIIARNITNKDVLRAMLIVPRHLFIPEEYSDRAYDDCPVLIGFEQTISQPYMVAYMTEILDLGPDSRVLEVGTGSGYQAAILAEICQEVYSIEVNESLADRAKETLAALGYKNLILKHGDGYLGWSENSPFDAIIVTCAPTHIPPDLKNQLIEGGKMIIPYGESGTVQKLVLLRKYKGEITQQTVLSVRFVPMIDEKGSTY